MPGFQPKTAAVQRERTFKEKEDYKTSLLSDISDAEKKLAEVIALLETKSEKVDEVKALNTTIETLTISKDGLVKDIGNITDELNGLKQEQEVFKQSIIDKDSILAQIAESTKILRNIQSDISTVKTELTPAQDYLNIIKSDIEEKKKEIENLTNEFDSKKQELQMNFEAQKVQISNDIQTLQDQKKSLDDEIVALNANIEGLTQSIIKSNIALVEIDNKFNNLEGAYKIKQNILDKEILMKQSSLDDRENSLNTRDGDLSLRESLLNSNTEKLRTIKTKLEQKIGSSINVDL